MSPCKADSYHDHLCECFALDHAVMLRPKTPYRDRCIHSLQLEPQPKIWHLEGRCRLLQITQLECQVSDQPSVHAPLAHSYSGSGQEPSSRLTGNYNPSLRGRCVFVISEQWQHAAVRPAAASGVQMVNIFVLPRTSSIEYPQDKQKVC